MIAAALFLWLARPAAAATGRLAVIEDSPFRLSVTLDDPLQQLIKLSSQTASLLDVQVIPGYYAGSDYRFAVEQEEPVETRTIQAAVLESPSQAALVYPAIPSLVDGLKRLAETPDSFKENWTVRLSSRAVTLSQVAGPDGEAILSALLNPDEEAAFWQNTAGVLYRLRWQGQDAQVLIIGKVFGGLDRLAGVLENQPKGVLGVSRGGIMFSLIPELSGRNLPKTLARLGLKYSAVSNSEMRHWSDVLAYQTEHPDGVRFLSANLVYSTAPAQSLLPGYALTRAGALSVALVGLTPPGASKYLGEAGLSRAKIDDPAQTLAALVPRLRAKVDAVVVLAEVDDDLERRLRKIPGVDLVIGRTVNLPPGVPGAVRTLSQNDRPAYSPPLDIASVYAGDFNGFELDVSTGVSGRDWTLRQNAVLLDDSVPQPHRYPGFDPAAYGITLASGTVLIPAARQAFPQSSDLAPVYTARDFWTMAASLLARRTHSEAALLRVSPLPIELAGQIKESVARVWLESEEPAMIVWLKGSDLKPLLAEVKAQQNAAPGRVSQYPAMTAGGIQSGEKIHGAPIQDNEVYRVATSQVLADALGLTADHRHKFLKKTIDQLVLQALRRQAGSPAPDYGRWARGRPVGNPGLWRVNFRDVGLNIQNTDVVASDAFNNVPNPQVQAFSQFLIGGDFKADADYIQDPLKWSNTLEMEYARAQVRPRDMPEVTNLAANRISLLTMGTKRAGSVSGEPWLAGSWGPSLGLQYDSQFEANPGLPRQNLVSAFPGVQLYDGSWIQSVEFTGAVLRDQSRTPPNTQYGFHTRWILTHTISSPAPITFNGEFFANYYFLTHDDTNQDLRFESDANLKLQFPIRKYLSVAPFIELYVFALKVQPVWGYSAMTGISIDFSRLWKPQYEAF